MFDVPLFAFELQLYLKIVTFIQALALAKLFLFQLQRRCLWQEKKTTKTFKTRSRIKLLAFVNGGLFVIIHWSDQGGETVKSCA